MDYGNERMTNSHCSLDPFRREIRVTALTDDKVLLMTSCESGAYNTVWLAWLVSRQRYVAPLRCGYRCHSSRRARRRVRLS